MARRFRLPAAFAALAVAAGACGGAKAGGVATLGDRGTTTTVARQASAEAKQDFEDAMLEYARCMREHGVDVPDPQFESDGEGGGQFKVIAGGPANIKDDAAFTAAQTACQPIMDKAEQNMPRPSPEQEAKMRDDALAMARCMREHGIDMPDPTFDSDGRASIQFKKPVGDSSGATGAVSAGGGGVVVSPMDDPKFKAAMEACGPKGGKAGVVTKDAR